MELCSIFFSKTILDTTGEILGASFWVWYKGQKMLALTYLSLLVKWHEHENVTSSGEAVCNTGVCWPLWCTPIVTWCQILSKWSLVYCTCLSYCLPLWGRAHCVSNLVLCKMRVKKTLNISLHEFGWTNYMLTFTRMKSPMLCQSNLIATLSLVGIHANSNCAFMY